MKKLILIFGLILALCSMSSAGGITDKHKAVIARSTEDFSDILFWFNAENCGSPPCTAYTLHASNEYTLFGDTTATFLGDAAINATANCGIDTYGLDATDDDSTYGDLIRFDVSSNDDQVPNDGRILIVFKTTVCNDDIGMFRVENTTDNDWIAFRTDATNDFYLVYNDAIGTKDLTSTGADCQNNTVYALEIIYDSSQAGGSDILKIRSNGSEIASDTTLTMAGIFATGKTMRFDIGNHVNFVDQVCYVKAIIWSNDTTRDLYDLFITRGIHNYPG